MLENSLDRSKLEQFVADYKPDVTSGHLKAFLDTSPRNLVRETEAYKIEIAEAGEDIEKLTEIKENKLKALEIFFEQLGILLAHNPFSGPYIAYEDAEIDSESTHVVSIYIVAELIKITQAQHAAVLSRMTQIRAQKADEVK